MKALDTNVLVRFLVKDDPEQAKQVLKLFNEAAKKGEKFFVPCCVVLEILWVLESVYRVPRDKILEAISDLLYMPVLEFEKRIAIHAFLNTARHTNADLSDILIGCLAKENHCEAVLTFDKKAARLLKTFELLESSSS